MELGGETIGQSAQNRLLLFIIAEVRVLGLEQILRLRDSDIHHDPVVLDGNILRDPGVLQPGENTSESILGWL